MEKTGRKIHLESTPHNNELQRTSDGNAGGSPLNSVLGGPWTVPADHMREADGLLAHAAASD
jgi:hypothetical protein